MHGRGRRRRWRRACSRAGLVDASSGSARRSCSATRAARRSAALALDALAEATCVPPPVDGEPGRRPLGALRAGLMFTGIVTDVGRVRAVRDTNRDRRFEIETAYDLATIDIGASISHAGCCLTVVEKGDGWFAVEVSGETLAKSTLGDWREGRRDQPGARHARRRRAGRPHRLRSRRRRGRGAVDRARGRLAPHRHPRAARRCTARSRRRARSASRASR